MLLAYAEQAVAETHLPIALLCLPLGLQMPQVTFWVFSNWKRVVRPDHAFYLEGVFHEIVSQLKANPCNESAWRLADLSMGPIRSIKTGECSQQEMESLASTYSLIPYDTNQS